MKVFIAGSYNAFTNELIKKFHKENDKVYVLTGEQYHGNKPHNVFEQYTFPYTGDSIIEVLDSVQPWISFCLPEHMIRISNGRICVVNPCTICPV